MEANLPVQGAAPTPPVSAAQELALVQHCAVQLRKALRCACCIAAVPGKEEPYVFSIDCGAAIRRPVKDQIAAILTQKMSQGETALEADSFFDLSLPDHVLRVESPSPAGARVVLLAFGVKKEKEKEALERMTEMEESLRIRIENSRLSKALAHRNSILGELLRSVSGLNRRLSSIGDLLQGITEEACRLLKTDSAAVFLPQGDEGRSFAMKACAGQPPGEGPQLNELFLRLVQEHEISGKKLLEDVGGDGGRRLMVPLIQPNGPVGILLFSSRDPAFSVTEDLLQMMELFSDWVSVVLENVTMLERVSASQREWENTFDSIFDPIYLIDPEYRLKKINKALASYAMLDIKLPRNQNCYRYLFHRDSLCPWCPVPRSLRTGQAVVVEAPLFTGGVWQIQSYPFTDKSDVRTGSINVLRDITLLKRIQEQLIESEKMASTGKLISGVAHEVRNPLFGISTTVRALANELGNKAELKPFLDIVTSETTRLNRLMEELLNYSRPVKIDKNPSDISEIIREVIGRYENVPGGKEIAVHLFGGENIPSINIDRNKIHQTLVNLVENGIQHSGDKPRIDIFLEYLSLSYPPEIHIVVKDYGSGIPRHILPRIFDPFFTTRSRGTGLGLSIVRKVVHDHGGRIAVESHPGVGTTFRIVLPVGAFES